MTAIYSQAEVHCHEIKAPCRQLIYPWQALKRRWYTSVSHHARPCRRRASWQKNKRRRERFCNAVAREVSSEGDQPDVLFHMTTQYNTVAVLKFPDNFSVKDLSGSTALFLDRSGNIHSIYRENSVLTGQAFYWDQLCIAATLAPEGPIGVLGLGCGTVPRIIHHFWPERIIHARDYMGMQTLEECGALIAHAGDALSDDATVEGGFAALIVDLFSEGKIIPQLQDPEVWKMLKGRLRPGGCLVANLGARKQDGGFCIKVSANNVLALSGAPPSPEQAARLPEGLTEVAVGWQDHQLALASYAEVDALHATSEEGANMPR